MDRHPPLSRQNFPYYLNSTGEFDNRSALLIVGKAFKDGSIDGRPTMVVIGPYVFGYWTYVGLERKAVVPV